MSEGALLREPSGQRTPSLPGGELPVLGSIQRLDGLLRGSDRGHSSAAGRTMSAAQLVWGHPRGVAQVANSQQPANAGASGHGFRPCSGGSPGGGHGSPLGYSRLGSPMDRGAWRAMVHGVTESDVT